MILFINKRILIDDCLFEVVKKISRCKATNLIPNFDISDMNLPRKLIECYSCKHMGIYLMPLTDGEIESIQDSIDLEEYYKTRTRDGIIEHLTKIYESDGMHGAGGGFANTSSENVTDGIADMMTKAESAMSTA